MLNLRAEHHIHIRITALYFIRHALPLRHTAANRHNYIRILLFKRLCDAHIAVHPVLRVLAHGAGVENYKLSLVYIIGKHVAHFRKLTLQPFGVTHILLTAECNHTGKRSFTVYLISQFFNPLGVCGLLARRNCGF